MNDDDALRRMLAGTPAEADAHEALETLRPRMRRARTRRRAATATIAASVIIGGAAGALALVPETRPETIRTSTITDIDHTSIDHSNALESTVPDTGKPPVRVTENENEPENENENENENEPGPTVLPGPEPASTSTGRDRDTTNDDGNGPLEPTDEERAPTTAIAAPAGEPPAADDDVIDEPTPTTTEPSPAADDDVVDEPTPTITTTNDPPQVTTSLQTITSTCGRVVVAIDGGTIRIQSIQPEAGYEIRVSADGPESVELDLSGSGGTCELHAELDGTRLQVEVHNPDSEH